MFLPKVVIICFEKKAGFDCKNNYKYNKLAKFWLNTISKTNFKILIIISYILLELKLRKVQPVWKIFK